VAFQQVDLEDLAVGMIWILGAMVSVVKEMDWEAEHWIHWVLMTEDSCILSLSVLPSDRMD
jgi:hypothetical protein